MVPGSSSDAQGFLQLMEESRVPSEHPPPRAPLPSTGQPWHGHHSGRFVPHKILSWELDILLFNPHIKAMSCIHVTTSFYTKRNGCLTEELKHLLASPWQRHFLQNLQVCTLSAKLPWLSENLRKGSGLLMHDPLLMESEV